jgi:hypothetical protein
MLVPRGSSVDKSGSTRGMAPHQHRDVLVRARDGDPAAFEVVIADRLDGLWRLARALLGSDEAASDAVSVVVLAAWRELPRLDDLDRFDPWLDRILLGECRMRLGAAGSDGAPPPAPADLLDSALARIREAPPRPPRAPAPRRRADLVPVIALTLGVVALVAVTAVGLSLLRPAAGPGTANGPSNGPGAVGSPAAASLNPSDGTATPGPVLAGGLEAGGLAVVTLDGDNLRVRSAPGTGSDSKRLKPVLPAGTRMLVVSGPVEADGYDWWEIQTDSEVVDLFGWVAAGDGSAAWIAPAAARCLGSPDAASVAGMSRIDFLACNGDAEVSFQADAASLWDVRQSPGACGWVRKRGGCDVENGWLLLASTVVRVTTAPGVQKELVVAMPPDLAAQLALLPRHQTLRLTVAMDSPDASACRIRDGQSGALLLPRDQAVTACRLAFVVQEVAFRQ